MKGYKFLEPQHADAMLKDGIIKIGTASHYATLESARRDDLDSAVATQLDDLVLNGRATAAQKEMLARLRIGIGAGAKMENVHLSRIRTTAHAPRAFMYCVSDTPEFSGELGAQTAIVEISDMELFASLLDFHLPEFGGYQVKKVEYRNVEFPPDDPTPLVPDYWVKAPKFAHEREIRIVWLPKPPLTNPQPGLMQILGLGELFRRVA